MGGVWTPKNHRSESQWHGWVQLGDGDLKQIPLRKGLEATWGLEAFWCLVLFCTTLPSESPTQPAFALPVPSPSTSPIISEFMQLRARKCGV